jgi:acyl dehydratase
VITPDRYADLVDRVGEELGVSGWTLIDQPLIDAFADLTDDHMWVHTDAERAARELPHGRTIAHGLLIFSLIPKLSYEIVHVADPGRTFSYGADRLRYVAPVTCGSRVRLRSRLAAARAEADRTFLTFDHRIEIEGQETPALVAEQILMTFT